MHSKDKPPTAAEARWMAAIQEYGCIVCRRQGRGFVPAAVHHLVDGSRRLGHAWTIPLCDPGHHQGAPKASGEVSRHPWWARFEAAYGTEMELLAATQEAVGIRLVTVDPKYLPSPIA